MKWNKDNINQIILMWFVRNWLILPKNVKFFELLFGLDQKSLIKHHQQAVVSGKNWTNQHFWQKFNCKCFLKVGNCLGESFTIYHKKIKTFSTFLNGPYPGPDVSSSVKESDYYNIANTEWRSHWIRTGNTWTHSCLV